jgi:enamine deaminase RidA (YjgF/YER057c/UK114 family)
MSKYPILISVLVLLVFLSGCVGQKTEVTPKEKATAACIQKCKDALEAGQDLSKGPCLDNGIIEGWVCDVTHSPRQPVDNDPANQCSEFGKTAFSFVEVDPNCNFIKTGSMV